MLTAYLRIPSFITTLAALSAFRGVAFMFNNGSPVSQVSPWLEPIFYGRSQAFRCRSSTSSSSTPPPSGSCATRRSAARSMPSAAMPTRRGCRASMSQRIQLIAFAIAGLMAAHRRGADGGTPEFRLSQLRRGTRAFGHCGGRHRRREPRPADAGTVLNTVIGAMTIVIVQNGLNLNAVPTSVQNVVIGAIIVLAVGIDMWRPELAQPAPPLSSLPLHQGVHR